MKSAQTVRAMGHLLCWELRLGGVAGRSKHAPLVSPVIQLIAYSNYIILTITENATS